jgi:hypothetical protein
MAGYGLSKSKITAWRQCPKRLWLQTHCPELLEVSEQTQQIFQVGNEVGEIAQQLCPNGILIENNDNLSAALAATKTMLAAHPDRPIFEATFQQDGMLVRADVMLPTRKGYRMTEVKSTADVKPYHVEDCAVQAWVLRQNKVKLASIELAHVDTSFVYQGDGNYHGLLKFVRLDEEIEAMQKQVPEWIAGARSTLSGDEPCIEPGQQCDSPFECQYKSYCTRDIDLAFEPEYPLDVLYRMSSKTKDELRENGYLDARKVPTHYLNATQLWIQIVSKSGKPSLRAAAAKQAMAKVAYPRYYIDFETITLAIPRWAGTRPYTTQVPFQWSCHIEEKPGLLRHEMFLDVTGNDPRRGFAESLVKVLGNRGSVLVYHAQFEKGRIAEMAERFPDLGSALLKINERVVDLLPIARETYYHPKMQGSWSIKAVLPTIAPDLGYDEMEVGNGKAAQTAYSEIIATCTPEDRKAELTQALSDYCELDTMAMVRLAWFLEGRKVVKGKCNGTK